MKNLDPRTRLTSAALVAALLAVCPGAVTAQESSPPLAGSPVEQRLAGIEMQLKQIVAAMAEASRYREIEVLMTRIQLKQRSLAPVDSELKSARAERKNIVSEREHMKIFMEEWEENMDDAAPEERQAMETEVDRGRKQFELLENRERELDQRILELENDLGRMRDDILTLEEQVDERLGLR